MGDEYPPEWVDIETRTALTEPMWEIFVPASHGKNEFSYEHHKQFDAYVKDKAGGITVLRGAKGEWISPEGKLYTDKVIPCRVCCSQCDIISIMKFALKHYNQKAIMAYKISDQVLMVRE